MKSRQITELVRPMIKKRPKGQDDVGKGKSPLIYLDLVNFY